MVNQETKPQVFISYSRKDINFARRMAADLEKAGFATWWDVSDLKGGDDWVRFIPTAIEASQFFVVLLSPESVKSEWVSKEYSYALRLRKKVVPAMIKPCDVPFALNTINYVDFVNDEYEVALNKLLVALGGTPLPVVPATGFKRLVNSLPPILTRNPFVTIVIGIGLILLALVLFSNQKPDVPVPPVASHTPIATLTDTAIPTEPDTETPSPTATITRTPTDTFTPTISLTPTITRTKTPVPVNFVLPTVCVQPVDLNVQAVRVRSGPPNDLGTPSGALASGLALEVGKCPLIGGRNEEDTWLMIAYSQTATEFAPYEGGWIRKDMFDLSVPVFIPEITLTPTPTITLTPTITPTFTPTHTATATPTYTPFPTLEPEATNTP